MKKYAGTVESASDRVRNGLTAQIRSGALAAGQRLPPERELAEQFKVSRMVVREALSALTAEGLLSSLPRCRPTVALPSSKMSDFEDVLNTAGNFFIKNDAAVKTLFETRIFFEKALARHAAEQARKEDIEALRESLAINHAMIGQRGSFEQTDMNFHHILYTIPGNPIYPALHEAYNIRLATYWGQIKGTPEIDRANYQGHQAVFNAIINRDARAAEQAMERHLMVAWELIQVVLTIQDT